MPLGFDNGSINSGWEWGCSQFDHSKSPLRLSTIPKSSVNPPSPDPNGVTVLKVLVNNGDIATNCANQGNQNNRAEVVLSKNLPQHSDNLFKENDDIWYHWYTIFPGNSYPTFNDKHLWQVWTQWHQSDNGPVAPDCSTGNGCTPAVEFNVVNSSLALRVLGHVYDHQTPSCDNLIKGQCGYKWVSNIQKDHWYNMLLHVKWSKDPLKGYMEMYVDGTRINPDVMGKNHPFSTLDVDGSVYMKQGLYRNPSIPQQQILYHDGMHVIKCPQDHDYYRPQDGKCYTTEP